MNKKAEVIVKTEEGRKFNGKIEPADMLKEAGEYFNQTDKVNWNFGDLCMYLHISTAKYKKLRESAEYKNATEYCDTMLESHYLSMLDGKSSSGAMFALKANYGYSDSKEIKTTVNGKLTIEQVLKGAKVKA